MNSVWDILCDTVSYMTVVFPFTALRAWWNLKKHPGFGSRRHMWCDISRTLRNLDHQIFWPDSMRATNEQCTSLKSFGTKCIINVISLEVWVHLADCVLFFPIKYTHFQWLQKHYKNSLWIEVICRYVIIAVFTVTRDFTIGYSFHVLSLFIWYKSCCKATYNTWCVINNSHGRHEMLYTKQTEIKACLGKKQWKIVMKTMTLMSFYFLLSTHQFSLIQSCCPLQ